MKIFLLILGACLIIAAAMAFVAMPVIFILPEYFASTAKIALDKSVPDLTSPDPGKIQTEMAVMQSPTVLYPVITNLNLSRIWAMKFRETLDLSRNHAVGNGPSNAEQRSTQRFAEKTAG